MHTPNKGLQTEVTHQAKKQCLDKANQLARKTTEPFKRCPLSFNGDEIINLAYEVIGKFIVMKSLTFASSYCPLLFMFWHILADKEHRNI